MPRTKSKTSKDATAHLGFEAKLWLAADKLRNNMDAAEYKHVVLGLVFLKYISDAFDVHQRKLVAGEGDYAGANPEDKDEYLAANVFWVIIPNQKKITAALLKGEAPDPKLGKIGKQRSLHNNYLTLPVVFLMLASHYPLLYATRFNWLIVAKPLRIYSFRASDSLTLPDFFANRFRDKSQLLRVISAIGSTPSPVGTPQTMPCITTWSLRCALRVHGSIASSASSGSSCSIIELP